MRNQKFVEDFNERPVSKPTALSETVRGMGIFVNNDHTADGSCR